MYSIYKIHYKDFCYVGITTNFKARMIGHKTTCLNQKLINDRHYNYPIYQVIRANDGWDAWTKEVVETTDDKTRERYWIEQISNLNGNVPTRTKSEYDKTHRNPKITCECGGYYSGTHKSRHFKSNKHLNYINTNG
jgi:predicted GIY-YIG superfamily endonuclease